MYDPTPSNSPPLSPPSLPPCRPAPLSTSSQDLSPLRATDLAAFNAFIKHKGDIEAICRECSLSEFEYFQFFAKPLVQAWFEIVKQHYSLRSSINTTDGVIEAIDKLRELMRTHPDPEGQRKSAAALARLDDRTPKARASSAASSLRGSASSFPFSPLTRAEKNRLVSIARPDGTAFTYDPKDPFAHIEGSHPLFQYPEVTDVGGPAAASAPQREAPADRAAAPLDSSDSSSLPSANAECSAATALSPLAETPSSNTPGCEFNSCPAPAPDNAETSVPGAACPVQNSAPEFKPPPDLIGDLLRLIPPAPPCPIDDFELPTMDPEDNTPFPKLDPTQFPKPLSEVTLPDSPREVANLRPLTSDISLTFARLKDPWYCLPKDGRGRPHKRRIQKDATLRHAFENIRRALFHAKSLAKSVWEENWEQRELARLLAEHAPSTPQFEPEPRPQRDTS